MRVTLADASLSRHAGRFVWLELNYDNEANQEFLARHGVDWTPAFLVLDPTDEGATATKFGGMSLDELKQFLDRGEQGFKRRGNTPPDAALARGDQLVGRGKLAEAADAYREALRLGGSKWAGRNRAIHALVSTLLTERNMRDCAETAARELPHMTRGEEFADTAHTGLGCANSGEDEPWAKAARPILEPLAVEATAVSAATRDDRFELYQQLMVAAQLRGDNEGNSRWGQRWLEEINSVVPRSDDERSALDVARMDMVLLLDQPALALPALAASERAMPKNYTASARLARVAEAAKRYDEALAACERGLAHVDGPIGRTGLLLTKASALLGKGEKAKALQTLDLALRSARAIGNKRIQENNVRRVSAAITELEKAS